MFRIEFDYDQLLQQAKSIEGVADQLPFALSLAMNRSADVTRNLLIRSTWPTHVKQRNASFIAASLTTRDARASKQSLAVEIYDKLDRGNLHMQAKGGTRSPQGGSNLAVPASNVPKTSRGVPARLRPKNMPAAVRKGDVLYAKDKKGRLRLLYVLKHQTKIPKRVPFYEDFAASMSRELERTIPLAVGKAMATRRR
ncbi:hypothetical protein HAP41_0000020690 [Bradyrhizobium barranii subsp. apii]|uniref:Uncharacterized protein n=1 Tax=Bradyrhizobium barranii subsp. apii TaxID=2819348 RepID=A0A8T5VIU7_9BRAD|nr:hypothetical protein [Bradyrhizobium barranii]UPT91128.1 hypothetical protein HAP41_0000020690 [Bradyrhizobium barranii subsp. apii]